MVEKWNETPIYHERYWQMIIFQLLGKGMYGPGTRYNDYKRQYASYQYGGGNDGRNSNYNNADQIRYFFLCMNILVPLMMYIINKKMNSQNLTLQWTTTTGKISCSPTGWWIISWAKLRCFRMGRMVRMLFRLWCRVQVWNWNLN